MGALGALLEHVVNLRRALVGCGGYGRLLIIGGDGRFAVTRGGVRGSDDATGSESSVRVGATVCRVNYLIHSMCNGHTSTCR